MSLIHDALLAQDGPALPARPMPRASWWARQSPPVRGSVLLAGAGLTGFLLAGALALAFGRHGETAQAGHAAAPDVASPAPVPAATVATGTGIATVPPAAPADAPLPQPPPPARDAAAAPQAPESPVPAAIARQAENLLPTATATATAGAEAETPPTIAAAPRAQRPAAADAIAGTDGAPAPIRIKVEHRAGNASADAGMENRAVEQAVGEVESAMARADLPAARQALARLDALLPPESLTLLRMQAWIAHAGNDTPQAETLYRRIVERVPDDVNAGVNIALLDARRGELDEARQRLTRLSGRYPHAPQVARALAELDSVAP